MKRILVIICIFSLVGCAVKLSPNDKTDEGLTPEKLSTSIKEKKKEKKVTIQKSAQVELHGCISDRESNFELILINDSRHKKYITQYALSDYRGYAMIIDDVFVLNSGERKIIKTKGGMYTFLIQNINGANIGYLIAKCSKK